MRVVKKHPNKISAVIFYVFWHFIKTEIILVPGSLFFDYFRKFSGSSEFYHLIFIGYFDRKYESTCTKILFSGLPVPAGLLKMMRLQFFIYPCKVTLTRHENLFRPFVIFSHFELFSLWKSAKISSKMSRKSTKIYENLILGFLEKWKWHFSHF